MYFVLVQDDIIDLTMNDISVQLPPTPFKSPTKAKPTPQADSDSDIEVTDVPSSPTKSSPSKSQKKSRHRIGLSAKAKGKRRARTEDIGDDDPERQVATGKMPSDAVFAMWRKGDDDMEPSTKMLGLIDLLNKWDATGDKTICYSQCRLSSTLVS